MTPRKPVVTYRSIYAQYIALKKTPSEARAEMRQIRELGRKVARGEATEAAALARLGGGR